MKTKAFVEVGRSLKAKSSYNFWGNCTYKRYCHISQANNVMSARVKITAYAIHLSELASKADKINTKM